jgi:exodeoxyribonuclease VII large subunit
MSEHIFSVSEINQYIKNTLENDPLLSNFWLKGEISNFINHSSGHLYFTIKDDTGSIKCVMFRSRAGRVRFSPSNGQRVIIMGYVSIYEKGGQYQLYVQEMVEDGIGDLYEKYEKLKKKLTEEGLFADERKRSLPFFPKRVGIVTSPTGAAIRDIITVIKRRMPSTEIILVPALVQGTGAAESIVQALEKIIEFNPEVIITGRGGGTIEDLWPFNEEIVVRKISQSPIPIISAVGHETDFTLSDFTADLRAATPSMAAELAVPNKKDLEDMLWQKERRLNKSIDTLLNTKKKRLDEILKRKIFISPEKMWENKNLQLEYLREKLVHRQLNLLKEKNNILETAGGKIDLLSPLKILSRGYSLTFNDKGNIVKTASSIKENEKIKVKLHEGNIICNVTEVNEND